LNRIVLAFRCFFNILFRGELSPGVLTALRLPRRDAASKPPAAGKPAAAPPLPASARTSDGALQLLAILQREGRLVDFLMEDIASYSDDQVGAAVRDIHGQCREALHRVATLEPVIDGVEGTFAKAPSKNPSVVRFVGNVPAKLPEGGILRHKGWRAANVNLPAPPAGQDAANIAPAEIEIE
jgi:Domain of unknown function (DUF2760)